jgi:hypothetical protein
LSGECSRVDSRLSRSSSRFPCHHGYTSSR